MVYLKYVEKMLYNNHVVDILDILILAVEHSILYNINFKVHLGSRLLLKYRYYNQM